MGADQARPARALQMAERNHSLPDLTWRK